MTTPTCPVSTLFQTHSYRERQLLIVAAALTHIRSTFPEDWANIQRQPKSSGARALKNVIKAMIRRSEESTDYRSTVSFVSQEAWTQLHTLIHSTGKTPKSLKSHLQHKDLSHEHMTPVETILRTLTHPKNVEVDIHTMLQALCCRALVTKVENNALTIAKLKHTLPDVLLTEGDAYLPFWKFAVHEQTAMRLIPLQRYYHADMALALNLKIPKAVPSSLDVQRWEEFQQWIETTATPTL